ncbi:myb family transcription factor PHL8-like isoform X2 [Arabidopsis lyrata subsp. lyrata]|uniref:myb family transcription factor PHL8-like isoform X2 n=1 Tax=Arabidopsis lyrata subsp. lyrata TaxID=81972 RepID=UPI000A29C0FC|nr:myb family transcription factor PHL8-like isoform X2 [Arabidopsis lyrata subsp. lyrata]|eukprot:XP_020868747.1 myb family transcription factor PHL8-like isoform X2 [Arabidopsis lyrata subsp. lyrata]
MDNKKNQKSKESKQRLRWSCELQNRFIDAVNQLGGLEKATPKGLMRIMEIPKLTLSHLKSHLQKYRLVKSKRFVGNKQEDEILEAQNPRDHQLDIIVTQKDGQPNKNLHIKEALEIQLEVQKKLHEQIEVQRQLQVRTEAQGKYLQSVLIKAQETLSGYTFSNLGIDFARSESELYRVTPMENRSCLSSSFSELTQVDEEEQVEEREAFLGSKKQENRGIRQTRSSVDSSLTLPESLEIESHYQSVMRTSSELELMELKPEEVMKQKRRSWNGAVCTEQPIRKRGFRSHEGEEDLGLSLNSFKDM